MTSIYDVIESLRPRLLQHCYHYVLGNKSFWHMALLHCYNAFIAARDHFSNGDSDINAMFLRPLHPSVVRFVGHISTPKSGSLGPSFPERGGHPSSRPAAVMSNISHACRQLCHRLPGTYRYSRLRAEPQPNGGRTGTKRRAARVSNQTTELEPNEL